MTARVDVLGVQIDALTMAETVERVRKLVVTERGHQHAAVNAAKLVEAARNPELAGILRDCSLVNADGAAVVWASRLLGRPLPERVAGIDLMERLVAAAADDGSSVFLLGARPQALARAIEVFRTRHPDLRVAGSHHGYWHDEAKLLEQLRIAQPDYLFVALPSPRKELWLARHLPELPVAFAMGVGGAVDVIAGERHRAPVWAQRAGLEWVFRLAQEPRRMWRRYLVGNSRFLALLARELLARARTT
jgi:N-acetylglucosaminyldiphosphoundecaprenol N-acetyl-beta-D-mannosaminyltransferase